MWSRDDRKKVFGLFVVFLVVSIALAIDLRPKHEDYIRASQPVGPEKINPYAAGGGGATPFQALLPVMLGFREVVASLMWVQADDLFHRGEYGPILHLTREIAAIDPHNLDVFATGAWHMAYNFMDRRLIEDGVDFLQTGVENNPQVYDLFFELGYMHYDKTKDFPEAIHYYREARFRPTTWGKPRAPLYVDTAYCHALERAGLIDEALNAWKEAYGIARNDPGGERDKFVAASGLAATKHNLYMTQRRVNEREATWLEWQGKGPEAMGWWQKNVDLARDYLKDEPGRSDIRNQDLPVAEANVARLRAGTVRRGGPKDLHFNYTWKRISPRRLLVQGHMDMVGLARVTVRLRDVDYEERAHNPKLSPGDRVAYKMANATLLEDHLVQVKDGKFRYELKLDEDPADMDRPAATIFPLKSDRYELSVTFNPRYQAADIQDRFGWNGEGLTDDHYVKVDPSRTGIVAGQRRPLRYLQKTVILSKSDIV
jgi:tetratricopeptide (TPR) repeat protein